MGSGTWQEDVDEEEERLKLLDKYLAEYVQRTEWSKMIWIVIPKKLLACIVLCCFCVAKYYYSKCQQEEDGSWVSRALYYPESTFYTYRMMFQDAFSFGHIDNFVGHDPTPAWEMSQ